MRWRVAPRTEIVDRGDERAAKEIFPDVIYDDPSRQWIRRIHEPPREIQPIRLLRARLECVQHAQSARLHFVAFAQKVSTDVNVGRPLIGDENRGGGFGVFWLRD